MPSNPQTNPLIRWRLWLPVCLVTALPLAHGPIHNQHLPKMGILGILAAVIIAVWATSLRGDTIRLRRSLLSISWLGFILCAAVAASRYTDGYSAAERLGYWAMLAILYFWAASADPSCLDRIAGGLGVAGAIAAAYGLLQSFYLTPVHSYGAHVSSFGNVNFAASYMAAVLPVISGWHWWGRKTLKWLAAAVVTWYLIRTGSRAAWIGAAAAIFTFCAAGGLRGIRRKTGLVTILAACAILAPPFAVPSWRGEILSRLASLADMERGSTRVRIEVWAGTCDMIGENFWLGAGTGQFAHHFHRYRYPEEYLISQGRLVDDPHQAGLLIFAECGVLAALLFASIAVTTAVQLVSAARRREPMAAVWAGSFVAVMVVGLFSSSLLFPATAIFLPLACGFADRDTAVFPLEWKRAGKWLGATVAWVSICLWAIVPLHLLAEFFFTRGSQAFHRRDFTAAEAFFSRAVRLFPDGIYQVEWGRALLARDNHAQAAEVFEAALARMPSLEAGYIDLGICRAGLRQEFEAEAIWKKACSLFPASAGAHYNLGRLLAGRKPKEARYHLVISSALGRPADFGYWALLAECYRKMGNYPQALIAWVMARGIDPEHSLPYLKIGLLSAHLPSGEDWYSRFSRAGLLKERPQHFMDHLDWGTFHETEGSTGQAWASYNRAAEIEPGSAISHLHIALIMQKTGLGDAALSTLQRVIDSGPTAWHSLACFYMGRILEERGDYAHACVYLQKSARGWVRPMSHLHLAQIALRLGKEHVALQHLQEADKCGFVDWELLLLPQLTRSRTYRDYLQSGRR